MGSFGGLLGLSGGAAGTGFAGPQQAQIQNPTSADQVSAAYTGNQGALGNQQALLQALQAQNGLGNQSQVYGQLQGVASGAVNPAQAQFAQNTQQNVANQAALMAGQRGANANVGLIARQAAQQGAGIQQQAVGQEAAQQAQNQIAAMGQAGQLATTQAGQQIGQTNANTQAQQAEQQSLLNAMQGYNTNQVASQSNVNQANASMAGTMMQGQQSMIGGGLGSAGASGFAAGARGGEITKMAGGGYAGGQPFSGSGPQSSFGQFVAQQYAGPQNSSSGVAYDPKNGFGQGSGKSQSPAADNTPGTAPTGVGGTYGLGGQQMVDSLGPSQPSSGFSMPDFGASASAPPSAPSLKYAGGGMTKDFRSGGKVNATSPKEKAVKGGNSYANDKIPAVLSEHEIVLPRSVTLSKDPVGNAAKFVAQVIAKRKGRK